MAANLPALVSHKDTKKPELNVANKNNVLQIKENQRMKRKAALLTAMNKIKDPDIA